MIDRTHHLSFTKQAKALGVSRGCLYYRPKLISEEELRFMNRIERLHLDGLFTEARML